jgi:Chaperone of endosialidase
MKVQNLIHIAVGIACIGLFPNAQAVVPPPDGGYPGGNTAEGQNALFSLTVGNFNTAVGFLSLRSITESSLNTAIGAGALVLNNSDQNTATGAGALLLNTTGNLNTANGALALLNNTTGNANTANGDSALSNNMTGSDNTAIGKSALLNNTTASGNTAIGSEALLINTIGQANTACGTEALFANTEGDANTGIGIQSLFNITTGSGNTAVGFQALINNTAGENNTAVGESTLLNCTGSGSIAIGSHAGEFVGSSNNVIAIGSPGDDVDDSCFIGNIRNRQTQNADAIPVLIDSSGMLGTTSSSRRFKKDVETMNDASEAILALRPVTFHYKTDRISTPQFGLIAEEVAEVNPNLVVRDNDGEIYTVRYDAVNAMLLNEFLKEHRKVEKLEATVAALTARLNEHDAKIQQVSNQLEIKSPDTRLAVSNR